ncbi:unnamed protein product [Chrysodeixis includens]|uniref:Uncharacterized protein n=1 Tax=Chrysodeixis includens TaxID=689277 RepID=A0A9P0BY16_CHRIL|nr:unnamed protein product [Chrysodeixis includens]
MRCVGLALLMVVSTINGWPTDEDLEGPVEVLRPRKGLSSGYRPTGQSEHYKDLEYSVGGNDYIDHSELYAQEASSHRRQSSDNFQNARFVSGPRSVNSQQARYTSRDEQNDGFRQSFHQDQIQTPSGYTRNLALEQNSRRSDRRSYSESQSSSRSEGDVVQSAGYPAKRGDYGQHGDGQFLQHGISPAFRDSSAIKGLDYQESAHSTAYSSHSEDAEEIDHAFVHSDVINNGYQVPKYYKKPRPVYYKPKPIGPSAYQRPKEFDNPLLRGSKSNGPEYMENEPATYIRERKQIAVSRNVSPSQPRNRNKPKDGLTHSDQIREFERNAQEYINKALKQVSDVERYAKEYTSSIHGIVSPDVSPTFAPSNDQGIVNVEDANANTNIPSNVHDINDAPVYQTPVYYSPNVKFANNPRYRDVVYPSVAKPSYPVEYPVHVRKGYIPRRVASNVQVVENGNTPSNNNKDGQVKVVETADNSQDKVSVVENAVNNNEGDKVKVVEQANNSQNQDGSKVTFVNNGNSGVNVVESPANPSGPGNWYQGSDNSHLLRANDDAPVYQEPYYLPYEKFANNPRYKDYYPNVNTKPNYGQVPDYPVHVRKGYIPRRVSNPTNTGTSNNEKVIVNSNNNQNVNENGSKVTVVENAVNNNEQDTFKVVDVAQNQDNGDKVTFVDNSQTNNGVNVVETAVNNQNRPGYWNQGPNSHLLRDSQQGNGPAESSYQVPIYYLPNGKFSNNPRYKDIYPSVKPSYGPVPDYPIHVRKGYIPRRVESNVIVVNDGDNTQNVKRPVNTGVDKVNVVDVADNSQNIPSVNESPDAVKVVENAVNNNDNDKVKVVDLPNNAQKPDNGDKVTFVDNNPSSKPNNQVNVVESAVNHPNRPNKWYQGPNSHLLRNAQDNQPQNNFPYEKFGNNPRYKDLYPNKDIPKEPSQVNVVDNAENTEQDKVNIVDNNEGGNVNFVDNTDGSNTANNRPGNWGPKPDHSQLLRDTEAKPVDTKLPNENDKNDKQGNQRPNVINQKFLNNPRYKDLNPNGGKPNVEYPVHVRKVQETVNTDSDGAPGFMTSPSNIDQDSENPDTVQNAYKSRPRHTGFRPYRPYEKSYKTLPVSNKYFRHPQNFLPNQVVNGPTTIIGGPVTGFQRPDISPVFADVIALPDGTYVDKPVDKAEDNKVKPVDGNLQEIVPTGVNGVEKGPSNGPDSPKPTNVVDGKLDQNPASVVTPNKVGSDKNGPATNEVPTIIGGPKSTDYQKPDISPVFADVIALPDGTYVDKPKNGDSDIVSPVKEKLAPGAIIADGLQKGEPSQPAENEVTKARPSTVPEESSTVTGSEVPDISPAFADVTQLPDGTYINKPKNGKDNAPTDNKPTTDFEVPDISPEFVDVIVQPDGSLVPANENKVPSIEDDETPINKGSLHEILKRKFSKGKKKPTINEKGEKQVLPSTQDVKENIDSTNVDQVNGSKQPNVEKVTNSVPVGTDKLDKETVEKNVDTILTKESSDNIIVEGETEGKTKRKHKKSRKHKKNNKGTGIVSDVSKITDDENGINESKLDEKTIENVEASKTDLVDGTVKEKISKKLKKEKKKHRKGGKHSKATDVVDGSEKTIDDVKVTEDLKITKDSDLLETVKTKKRKSKRSKNSEDGKIKKKRSKKNKGKKIDTDINSDSGSKKDDVIKSVTEIKSDKTEVLNEKDELKVTEILSKDEEETDLLTKVDGKVNKGKKKHGKKGKEEISETVGLETEDNKSDSLITEETIDKIQKKDKKSRKHKNKQNIDVTEQIEEESVQEEIKTSVKGQDSSISEKTENIKAVDDIKAVNSDASNQNKEKTVDVEEKTEKVKDAIEETSDVAEESVKKVTGKKKPSKGNDEETDSGDESSDVKDGLKTKDIKSEGTDDGENRDLSKAKVIRKLTRHYKVPYPKRRILTKIAETDSEKEKSTRVTKNKVKKLVDEAEIDEIDEKLNIKGSKSKLVEKDEISDDEQTDLVDEEKAKLKKHRARLSLKNKGKISKNNENTEIKSKSELKKSRKSYEEDAEIESKTEFKKPKKSRSKDIESKSIKNELDVEEEIEGNDCDDAKISESDETQDEIYGSRKRIKREISEERKESKESKDESILEEDFQDESNYY